MLPNPNENVRRLRLLGPALLPNSYVEVEQGGNVGKP
jgi:hypothetical protein